MKNKKILLVGGYGVVGSYLQTLLKDGGYYYLAPKKNTLNLLDRDSIKSYIKTNSIDTIINLAAIKTNIKLNETKPWDIYEQTIVMNLNLFSVCREYQICKILSVISSCAYPFELNPIYEDNIDSGPVHSSISPHGNAKRSLYHMSKYSGLNSTVLSFNNIYGGCDFSRLDTLKVADNLVQKFCLAKSHGKKQVVVWGTGVARREFLFYKDASESLIQILKHDDNIDLVNIGNGIDYSIRELAETIRDLVDPSIEIVFDTSKPDGQMKKLFDNSKMKAKLGGWEPRTDLYSGLKQTIEWYVKNHETN